MDIEKLDLYDILGISVDATEKEIVKAYRKRALKCHPDKNPDNPHAAELFHQLSKSLEILTDAAARAAYNKILKARKAAEIRQRELSSKRRKLREDLESREKAADTQSKEQDLKARRNLKEEIERLRKEGSRLLEEEKERLKTELLATKDDAAEEEADKPAVRLKLKWSAKKGDPENGGYDQRRLQQIFLKYGEINALIVSGKRNGSAIIEMQSAHAALMAVENEIGLAENRLHITWLSGKPTANEASKPQSTASSAAASAAAEAAAAAASFPPQCSSCPSNTFASFPASETPPPPFGSGMSHKDFENIVLMKMRQAQERKRLAQQMIDEDKEEGT
ncbi:hypothetical protein CAPTEDRAFT_153999 [Capitella teleta]|uniref:DnaJ homolog subfamily C member 17 n=1 Tax=Capitella teleta TaxID=283909 RepID=R7U0E8_CAPTE|nr:hypothetical protein CAPTEDRAFT_153999 [Capitella teleta]|eukprot:ELT99474.1 hypothetical protein CAPTEDRAFT_153999 [Capitella teleta]